MPIDATHPTDLSAIYDRWAIQSAVINGDGCCAVGEDTPGPITAAVNWVKARVRAGGATWERSPLPSDTASAFVPDVLAEIATGSELGKALAAALAAVQGAAVLAAAGKL
jgi:hypothetical protein